MTHHQTEKYIKTLDFTFNTKVGKFFSDNRYARACD